MNVLSRSCRSCAWRYGRARRLSGHRGSSRHLAAGHVRSSAGSSAAYCLDLVRRYDHEHYLCCLLLPRDSRSASIALRALNIELAQVKDVVSEKPIGEMRIQFWRDAIDLAYKGTPPQHPVAKELAVAIRQHQLSKHWLTRLLNAREKELGVSVYMSTGDLEHHAESTASSLLYLTLQTLGVKDVTSDHAASHVGKAQTITTLLRAMPYHRSRRTVLIPMDIVTRHGASQEDFLRGDVTQAVKDATFDLASLANTHLHKARSMKTQLSKTALRALLPAVVCDGFLTKIQKAHFNPFHPSLASSDPMLTCKLLWKTVVRKSF